MSLDHKKNETYSSIGLHMHEVPHNL